MPRGVGGQGRGGKADRGPVPARSHRGCPTPVPWGAQECEILPVTLTLGGSPAFPTPTSAAHGSFAGGRGHRAPQAVTLVAHR